MRLQWRRLSCLVGVTGLVLTTLVGTVAVSSGSAAAAARRPLCVGTTDAPGTLAGNYRSSVMIEGVCAVNAGPTTIHGKLFLAPGSALVAAFALNDLTGKSSSRLTVLGSIIVQNGASLILGCEPGFFSCIDDPNGQTGGTLSSAGVVRGNVIEEHPLGVIIHNSTINGNVRETGGGGGTNCDVPETGLFSLFQSPVYSDLEDNVIHGDVTVSGYQSCWLGFARDGISGNLRLINNQLADPDAVEILSNQVSGDLVCQRNSMVWDSVDESENLYPRSPEPNTVNGSRVGQCVLSSPTEDGGPPGPGPF